MIAEERPFPGTWLKMLVVGGSALLTTVLCFYLMMFLIRHELSQDIETLSPSIARPEIAEPREEQPLPMRTRPQKVMPLTPPPDPDATALNRMPLTQPQVEQPTFGSMAELIGPVDVQLELDAPNSELTPVFVVQPAYPLRAEMREIEGYVIVQFSVKADGSVIGPFVVESKPGNIFDEAALAAISRFRFKPREVGGDPVRVDNVQLRFAFTLESLYEVNQP